jgi:hypothetical protein
LDEQRQGFECTGLSTKRKTGYERQRKKDQLKKKGCGRKARIA